MKLVVSSLVVWSSSFATAGCMEPEDSPALDSTEQAVTTPIVTSHTCTSGWCPNLVISGSGAGVCFLTEIDGDLAYGGSARIHQGFGSVWYLDILGGSNLKVVTACLNL